MTISAIHLFRDFIVIEYINGQTLDRIDKMKLTFNDKLIIVFQLMLIIKYIHDKELIYRDLKPNNVMIDEDKTIVLIDFDRIVDNDDNRKEKTVDMGYSLFVSPEFYKTGKYSYKSDIYSLGKMIEYIMNSNKSDQNSGQTSQLDKYSKMYTKENEESVPCILFIIQEFILELLKKIRTENYEIICRIIDCLSLAANQNILEAQYNLGLIYNEGKYIERDIDKAIQYFLFAANQNYLLAQHKIGFIYCQGKYVPHDINKAIHYFSRASNHNYSNAQINLGFIYHERIYIARDINKAIHFYSLAANNNHLYSQLNLGLIYFEGKYITRDVDKAIYYFTLAAK